MLDKINVWLKVENRAITIIGALLIILIANLLFGTGT
jgi:hypothetical protein